jgi:hypothetical protein
MGSRYRHLSALLPHLSLFLVVLILLWGTTACNTSPPQVMTVDPDPATKIAHLAQKSEGKTVIVQGKVGTIAPLLKQSVYELRDESGVIWVLTNDNPPPSNTQVKVHGIIRSSNGERYLAQK